MTPQPERAYIFSSNSPDDWSDEWFREIGWIGYYFGQMEWAPYLLGARVGCSNTKRKKMQGLTFSERCAFAKTDLIPKLDAALQPEWTSVFDEISMCGTMRNDILHNPLELNVSEIEAHGIKFDQGIRILKRGGKILTLGEVQQYSTMMISLHKRVIELLARTPMTPSAGSAKLA